MKKELNIVQNFPTDHGGAAALARATDVHSSQTRAAVMCKYARMQRKYAYRRKLPHYQWIDKTYFITFSTRYREVLPSHARDLILETCLFGNGKRYHLDAVVVMPDHVHLVLTPLEDEDGLISLPEILQEIKSVSAHRVNKCLGRKGSLWQQESFDRAMREVENTLGKWEYVLGNPVRAGLVNDPYDYRWLWTASTGEGARASKIQS